MEIILNPNYFRKGKSTNSKGKLYDEVLRKQHTNEKQQLIIRSVELSEDEKSISNYAKS